MTLDPKITKFLEAYYTGAAQTFVNPDSGELVSACYHVRSFAAAILRGPTPKRPDVEGTSVSYDAPEPITGT